MVRSTDYRAVTARSTVTLWFDVNAPEPLPSPARTLVLTFSEHGFTRFADRTVALWFIVKPPFPFPPPALILVFTLMNDSSLPSGVVPAAHLPATASHRLHEKQLPCRVSAGHSTARARSGIRPDPSDVGPV
jgi:hypothetical protein